MKVVVTGAAGMLGSAVVRAWAGHRPQDEVIPFTRDIVDLRDRSATLSALKEASPSAVIHAAAKVGGIAANVASPAEFLADNLAIDLSVIEGSREAGVQALVYFGSSCMYPRDYRQPLVEGDILRAPLEPTNEGYAIAKIAGAKLCEYISRQYGLDYRAVMPSNLYGPNDHYGSRASHLVAAAIYKAHAAKQSGADHIEVWGDGTARREFTYVEDVATWLAGHFDALAGWPPLMNVGLGRDYSIREFYEAAMDVVGYHVELRFDASKPAGMHQKLMDSSLAAGQGWVPETDIRAGMASAYAAYLASLN